MRKLLQIALLQMAPGDTLEENLEKGLQACHRAREQGADLALFPEKTSCRRRSEASPKAGGGCGV